jgi:hypothetical protein
MEPVTSIVSAIFKVLQEAEQEARRNQTRCHDLAERAQVVSNILRDATAAGRREEILCRLRAALDHALKLVESCGRRDGGLWCRISAALDSRALAARFDDVDRRINNCLAELSAASGVSIENRGGRFSQQTSGKIIIFLSKKSFDWISSQPIDFP